MHSYLTYRRPKHRASITWREVLHKSPTDPSKGGRAALTGDSVAAVRSDEIATLHRSVGLSGSHRMPQVPKPFVGRDETFFAAPIRGSRLM